MKNKGLTPMSRRCMMLIPALLATLPLLGATVGRAQTTPAAPSSTTDGAMATPAKAAQTSSQPKGTTMIDSATYVIGAEDNLQVTFWKEPTLSGTFPVRPDGMISLVLAAEIPPARLTPTEQCQRI